MYGLIKAAHNILLVVLVAIIALNIWAGEYWEALDLTFWTSMFYIIAFWLPTWLTKTLNLKQFDN